MNVSLDGYVDHDAFAPDDTLFRHWIDHVRVLAATVYGRRIYEIMQYWDEDRPEWTPDHDAFATAWRRVPKFVVSRTLDSVGPNATLVRGDVEGLVRRLTTEHNGEVSVAGPALACEVGKLGLVDEYRLYLHPVVLGGGTPFFAGPLPPLRLSASERVGRDAIRLVYVPA
jgi:dihydrofolate reductase